MNRIIKQILLLLLLLLPPLIIGEAAAQQAAQQEINELDTGRIVVVGDVHGDYNQLIKLLRATGLIDKRRRWSGADARLVQMGDLTDRGPSSRQAIDFLIQLNQQAQRDGGAVHVLIGNHEAMNMTGDLRYVHPGEYRAFRDARSKRRRDAYYQRTLTVLRQRAIEQETQLPVFDDAFRKAWEEQFPIGYVEHRLAWSETGQYGLWTLSNSAVLRIGRSLFVHGGISEKYANTSINELNIRVRTDLLRANSLDENSIVEETDGPLWYRGWAILKEDDASRALLERILANFDVDRIVMAHSPLLPGILPRFDSKVLMVDVGLAQHYGSGFAALEIVGDSLTALHGQERLEIPKSSDGMFDYLDSLELLVKDKGKVQRYRQRLLNRQQAESATEAAPQVDQLPLQKAQ